MSQTPSLQLSCISCRGTHLLDILSLGYVAVSDFGAEPVPHVAPLDLVICDVTSGGCGLVQLKHRTNKDDLYRTYWYRSSINESMRGALADIVRSAERVVDLRAGDVVVDIGANDGTLLSSYMSQLICKVGFEPARNITPVAQPSPTTMVNDFFNASAFFTVVNRRAKAKVITAIAMFYDLDDPNNFLEDVRMILDPDGVFVVQMAYLPSMLSLNNFDNICHEHLAYYSLTTLARLLKMHGFRVCDVSLNTVNGGSFRVFARLAEASETSRSDHRFRGGDARIRAILDGEQHADLNSATTYIRFRDRVRTVRATLRSFIEKEVSRGRSFYGYGASTKGNTILQYVGLSTALLTAIADRSPEKWGLRTVASNIPIVSEEVMRAASPDYLLVLPWHFRDAFVARESAYLSAGGRMIFPLPVPQVLTQRSGGRLQVDDL